MTSKIRAFLVLLAISVLPTLIIWFPFFFRMETVWGIPLPRDGMATIVANFDGPLFIAVAKSLYKPEVIGTLPFTLPKEYYAAHFPLFPLLIKAFAAPLGFPYSMLFVTILSSILAVYFFHKLIGLFVDKKDTLWMTIVFAIFPARYLIVRSVGSAEPLFLASIIASIYFFRQKKYLLAGIWGALAQVTKSPAILLFLAYLFALIVPKFKHLATHPMAKVFTISDIKKFVSITLIPVSLVAIFIFFKFQMNDFLAYFHSGDNIHLFFPPFQIFNYAQPWVGTFWLEEVIFVYLLGYLGLIKLIQMKEYEIAWFVGVFFSSILFVSHRDIIRYSLPIVPFLLVAYSKIIVKKEFKYAIALLAVPIYLYSLSYISKNVMPIADWAALL